MNQDKPTPIISSKCIIHRGEKRIILNFTFDHELYKKIKLIQGRRWSKSLNAWHLPDNAYSLEELAHISKGKGVYTKVKATRKELQKGSFLFFKIPVEAFALRKEIKKYPKWYWHNIEKEWSLPSNDKNKQTLNELGLAFNERKNREVFINKLDKRGDQEIKPGSRKEYSKKIGVETLEKIEEFQQWMEQKRYSNSSIKTYISFLKLFFADYPGKLWNEIHLKEVREYNHRKFIKTGQSYSSQNQFINALKLFYNLHKTERLNIDNIERPRRKKNLPGVLSKEEVQQIIGLINNNKHKCLLAFVYGAGLRIGEALSLELTDVRKEEKLLYIRKAKGMKDRRVPLSGKMLILFDAYKRTHLPRRYVFEGQKGGKYSATSAQQVFKRAVKKAGITVPVTLHTLRHSYATHLMESGVGLRYIQEVLGHSSPKTTMIYTHVSGKRLNEIRSPLEDMDI